jgi:hypothetical protein
VGTVLGVKDGEYGTSKDRQNLGKWSNRHEKR